MPAGSIADPRSIGGKIAHYELIRKLGQGGMGAVFLARDERLGRLVALKLLTALDGPGAARFLVEARATARCKHENIVVIHDVGEHEGCPYMVLEHIEGQSLQAWVKERRAAGAEGEAPRAPVPPSLCVELMLPVARALTCAHKRGIVHRDLKPGNIMLDASGPIKVLDFGIAKVHEGEAAVGAAREGGAPAPGELVLTGKGALIGTLPYMSPEQWGKDAVDARSDLWAVGVMLFELVTGAHPLAPLTPLKLAQVSRLGDPMPSALAIRPDLGPLGEVIDRCLKKRKAERIASAEELCAALEALLPGQKAFELGDGGSPFTGLHAFQEADAARFFGRERDVTAAMSRLHHQALLAVAGPSGAGKSSFVRAGLVPALKLASTDSAVQVWNADGAGKALVLNGHDAYINWAAWSPDGRHIVSASNDKTVWVWSADGTGKALVLRGHTAAVLTAAWSPDGRRIVAVVDDKTIVIWSDVEPLSGAEDPKLWTATTYCMPIEIRQRLLDFPEEQSRADLARCERRVREAQADPAGSRRTTASPPAL